MSTRSKPTRRNAPASHRTNGAGLIKLAIFRAFAGSAFFVIVVLTLTFLIAREHYTFSLQSPFTLQFRSPLVMVPKASTAEEAEAQSDQFGHRLTAFQQYACNKFGSACRVALAIQRAENPRGACEIYHYNSDGTLDWGYFQINTVHLKRVGVNLRDLLDCKANIDFAYRLYQERGFQPWSTYNNGAYLKYIRQP